VETQAAKLILGENESKVHEGSVIVMDVSKTKDDLIAKVK